MDKTHTTLKQGALINYLNKLGIIILLIFTCSCELDTTITIRKTTDSASCPSDQILIEGICVEIDPSATPPSVDSLLDFMSEKEMSHLAIDQTSLTWKNHSFSPSKKFSLKFFFERSESNDAPDSVFYLSSAPMSSYGNGSIGFRCNGDKFDVHNGGYEYSGLECQKGVPVLFELTVDTAAKTYDIVITSTTQSVEKKFLSFKFQDVASLSYLNVITDPSLGSNNSRLDRYSELEFTSLDDVVTTTSCGALANGESESRQRFKEKFVDNLTQCEEQTQTRTCTNGVLSDFIPNLYQHETCQVLSTSYTFQTKSIEQYGITWTFRDNVTAGKFVNGDYFVIDSGSGVIVDAISPNPSNGNYGSMVNPVPSQGQALSSRGEQYVASLGVSLPLTLKAKDSLVSSIASDDTDTKDWAGNTAASPVRLRTAAILTVLGEIPAQNSFRPSYMDPQKRIYNISRIDFSLLPSLSLGSTTHKPLSYYERGLERPWLLFGNDWQSRSIHPSQNMNNYHEKIGAFLSEASAILMTDLPNKEKLLYLYIQTGIDYFNGRARDSASWAWPIVFTGLMLNEEDMYNYWINNPGIRTQRDHEKFYYIGDRNESTQSSIIPKGNTWVAWKTTEGKSVAFSKQKGEEYEHLHPSEWTCFKPHCKGEVYRAQHDVYPIIGTTLASILMDRMIPSKDVNAMLAHNPIRDYADRWMSNIFKTGMYKNTGRTYLEEMQNSQVFTIYYLRYGSSSSSMIDHLWKNYR